MVTFMKRFIKAAWNSVNYHPSQTSQFSTRNIHLYENVHAALTELSRLGIYKIEYWNCRSTRAFYKGDIDYNYKPNLPEELYISDLTIAIEQDPHTSALVAYYKFRAAQFVETPMQKKLKEMKSRGTEGLGDLIEYQAILLRNLSLEMYGMVQKNVETPFAALETLKALSSLRKIQH